MGSYEPLEAGTPKKSGVFPVLFFDFPPPICIKITSIRPLFDWLTYCLTYEEGSPECSREYILCGAPTGSQARQVGIVPTIAAHPGEYFDGTELPVEAREARGMSFPRLLHPRAHPIKP